MTAVLVHVPRRFIIVPGHALPQFEKVVDGRDAYEIVEKDEGPAAELAEETDPRS